MINTRKKILVTGGAGYIGSHTIVELVAAGYDVVSIDNFSNSNPLVFERIETITGKRIENIEIDLCDYKKLEEVFQGKTFDAIIHLAAFKSVPDSLKNPLAYYQNNVDGLLGALLISKLCKTSHFIFSSTCAVYDPETVPPYAEISPIKPGTPYGMTKLLGEQLLEDYVKNTEGCKAITLRYFNPAGAHPSGLLGENTDKAPENLVSVVTDAVKTGKPFTVFGDDYATPDGTCVRDYLHVADVAKAHVSALEHLDAATSSFYDVFNIGTGKGISVKEIISAFETENNIKVPYEVGARRAGDMPIAYADASKAASLLQWVPKYSLADIVKTAWGWELKKNQER